MFGIRSIKFQPSEYAFKYRNGKIMKEGAGISFYYFAPKTSIVMVQIASSDCPFMFEEVTSDYQTVSVQGQITYRIIEPHKVIRLLDHTMAVRGGIHYYLSEDPQKISLRMSNLVRVLVKKHLENVRLADAVRESEPLAQSVLKNMRASEEVDLLGIEIMSVTVLAVLPTKETSRALEAEIRERLLKKSDDALYERRNASIEQERGVKENEYNTEIAIENKRREVRQTQLDAEQAEMQKQNELEAERMDAQILLEEKRRALIDLVAENTKAEADARVYELRMMMQILEKVNIDVIKALAMVGMQPQALIANAFQSLAENAEKIGHLNITPDLMREMMAN